MHIRAAYADLLNLQQNLIIFFYSRVRQISYLHLPDTGQYNRLHKPILITCPLVPAGKLAHFIRITGEHFL
jgi:hypothetical protein